MENGRIHMINMNGITLVLDVESDTLHRVDDVAGEVIALLNEEVAPRKISKYS